MGRPVDLSLGLSLDAIVADTDKFHIRTSSLAGSDDPVSVEQNRLSRVLKRATIFISGRYFVPPSYFFLAELPAQIDDSTITDMREIAQPKIDIFDDDSQFKDRMDTGADVLEALDVMDANRRTATKAGVGRRFPHFLTGSKEGRLPLLHS